MSDLPGAFPEPVPLPDLSEKSPAREGQSPSDPAIVFWGTMAAGKRYVLIRVKDQTYQLRETRNGKLILTK